MHRKLIENHIGLLTVAYIAAGSATVGLLTVFGVLERGTSTFKLVAVVAMVAEVAVTAAHAALATKYYQRKDMTAFRARFGR